MNPALPPTPRRDSMRHIKSIGRSFPRAPMKSTQIPPFVLLTNDHVELVHRELRLQGEALWYTHHGYRGLFGGIWRTGRTFFTPEFGACLGPEVFYPVGANDQEALAAFGQSRTSVIARESRVARAALAFVEPIARELHGAAFLELAERNTDRHVLHVFLPISSVQERFTSRDWFLFWRQQNAKFHIEYAKLHCRELIVGSCA